jgi:hypothetical protein
MRRKMEWEWEILDEFTKRAKVIGGWLIQHGSYTNKGSITESMVFVPDKDHDWTIVKPIQEKKPTVKATDFEPK